MNKHRIGALIAAMALTLTFAGTALGATETWGGNGYPVNENCEDAAPGTTVWIWTGGTPTGLTVNGVAQDGEWVQSGQGSWKFVTAWLDSEPDHDTTFVTYTGDSGTLTITHGCAPEITTTTSDTTTSDTTTTSTTSDETTSTTSTSTTTTPTGSLFAFPTASIECGGSITVSNFASANVDDVLITGPGDDLIITADGTYPLVPGEYVGVGRVADEVVTDEFPFTIEACPTTTTSAETTPGGSVEELTPPSTDTIGQPTSGSTVSTGLLLVLAGILSMALVAVPAAARKRR
jgi:hypothetical protein